MSNPFAQILKDFSGLPGDYRGEVFAAELIKNGLSYDRIYFKTLSIFKRPTSKDIEAVKLDIKENGEDQVLLELNREGLYDMLPEGIFHFKNSKTSKKDIETILNNIRQSRAEERHARKFFGPFENEFFQLRLQLELKKRSLLQPGSAEGNKQFFESIFGDTSVLNEEQVLALLYILPIAYKVRGNLLKIAYCISILIRYKVKIELNKTNSSENFRGALPRLGNARLGIDTIAGNRFQSFDFFYDIHIADITKEKLTSFFKGGSNFAVIQYASNFLFPSNSVFHLKLHVKKKDREAFLSGDKNETFLGFNCYL